MENKHEKNCDSHILSSLRLSHNHIYQLKKKKGVEDVCYPMYVENYGRF